MKVPLVPEIIVRIYTICDRRNVTSKTHQTLTCTNMSECSIEEAD